MLKDRPTQKTEFTAGQRSYITKLANKFSREIEKPELFVFKKLSPQKARELSSLGYKAANNTVPIRAPYGATVRVTRDRITIENVFEKNTVFLTDKSFTQFAGKMRVGEDDEEELDDEGQRTGYWRFADGADISSKLYSDLSQAVAELQNYKQPGRARKGGLSRGALPVFSQQKLSGLTGFDQEEIERAKRAIIEQIPAGTVRKNGKKTKLRKA